MESKVCDKGQAVLSGKMNGDLKSRIGLGSQLKGSSGSSKTRKLEL